MPRFLAEWLTGSQSPTPTPAPTPSVPYPLVAAGFPAEVALPAGSDLAVPFTLSDANGNPAAGLFTGSDPFTAVVWPGGGQPAACASSAAWTDASRGEGQFVLAAADTAGVAPAVYRVRLSVSHGGKLYTAHEGSVEFTDGPGTAAALKTYVGYQKLLELAPWVASCFDPARHLAGFLAERATARQTFDQLCITQYRSPSIGQFGTHSSSALSWGGGGVRRTPLPSQILTQWLAADLLMVTPQVERINAMLAIAEIGLQQVGINNTFAAYGQAFADRASAEISTCTATLDTNGDGVPEIPIPLGVSNTLFT